MKKLLAVVLCLMLAAGCMVAAGAEETGSTYRSLYSAEVTTLNYLYTATTNDFDLSADLVETLVRCDQYGQIVGSLADEWTVSDDGLVYTFHIRDGAVWCDAAGNVVTDVVADDFVAALEWILDAANASSTSDVVTDYVGIAGASEYYEATSAKLEDETVEVPDFSTVGVKAVDEDHVEYTLNNPAPYFLSSLDYVCFMPVNRGFLQSMGENFGAATGNDTLLYCGAYTLAEFAPQEKRVLVANPNYWDKDEVHITRVEETYNKEAGTIGAEMFLRGEVDSCALDSTTADAWLADPESAAKIHPLRNTSYYSYFFCFDFDPQFDAEYEPENWKLAVGNENFRKSLYYGLDRTKAMLVYEPDNPDLLLCNTITLPNFVTYSDGVDYVSGGAVADVTALGQDVFNTETALQYRDAAIEELTAAGATFPIKALMCYNPTTTGWDEMCQVVEQQIEETLGADYIDIVVEAGPSTGFLSEVRRSGKYALLLCNYGPDFSDPLTYTDAMCAGNTFNFFDRNEDVKAISDEYNAKVAEANAIYNDTDARYQAFSEAEKILIDHAIVIPFGNTNGGYSADMLDPFACYYSPCGLSNLRYAGQKLLDAPMDTDAYYDAYDAWVAEREAVMAD